MLLIRIFARFHKLQAIIRIFARFYKLRAIIRIFARFHKIQAIIRIFARFQIKKFSVCKYSANFQSSKVYVRFPKVF